MIYRVQLSPRARIAIANNASWWATHRSVDQAQRWMNAAREALHSLAQDPHRWPVAPENDELPFEIREMAFGLGRKKTHRAVFEVREDSVLIHAIRHLAQAPLTTEDFE